MFALTTLNVYAQSDAKQIQGYVLDSAGVSLKNVTIRLTSTLDTLTAVSSEEGHYLFDNVKGKDIRLAYSMLGFQIINRNISDRESISFILMPNVVLSPQSGFIENVYVVKTIPVIYGQDTVQYNMDAFTFRKNSLLEEALKQLPGIHVGRDGAVYAQGRLVSSVQVNGKKFFGGDVLTATRNLPADFVSRIQIIDYYGESATGSDLITKTPDKIINIVLKEDKTRISFGQVTAGGGTKERFIGSMGINRFDDGQEFSIIGSLNNTNTSLFSFGAPSGVGGREKTLYDGTDFLDGADGLNNVKSLGFNFSDNIAEQTQFNVSYMATRRDNITEGNSVLMSNYVGNPISNTESYKTYSEDIMHRLSAEFKHKFKNNDLIEVKPMLSYNKMYVGNDRKRRVNNNKITNDGSYRDSSYTKSPNMDLSVFYSKAFSKPGRKLVGNFGLSLNSQDKSEDVSDYYLSLDSTSSKVIRSVYQQELYIKQDNGTDGLKASISYVEPFSDANSLEFTYDYEFTNMHALRMVEDRLKSEEIGRTHYVDSLGVNYDYRYRSSKVGLHYQYKPNERFRANVGFAVQPIKLEGFVFREDDNYSYSNVSLVPTAGFKWRLSDELDWSVSYVGKDNQPNFLHIIPVRDNSNSQNIIIGNPALKAEFSNRINTTLRKFITSRNQYFETNFAYNFILNRIVSDKRSVENSTTQETSFKNASGYYDLKWYFMFNTPLFTDELQLDLLGSTDFYNNLSYVNDRRHKTRQFIYTQSLQVRYTWSDYFESMFNANYMLNNAHYTWPISTALTANTVSLTGGTKGYLSDAVTLGAEVSQRFNSGYESSFMNNSPTILNAYMEFAFMRNKMAMLRLQCFDVLDQNKNMGTYSEYIGNDLYEARNNRLGRYLMLTLNIRLQSYPKKK